MYVDFDEKFSNHPSSTFNVPTNYHPPLPFCLFRSDTVPAAAVLSPVPLPSLVTLDVSSPAHHDNQAISDMMGA